MAQLGSVWLPPLPPGGRGAAAMAGSCPSSSSTASPDPPKTAAAAILERFDRLGAENARLEARIQELESELRARPPQLPQLPQLVRRFCSESPDDLTPMAPLRSLPVPLSSREGTGSSRLTEADMLEKRLQLCGVRLPRRRDLHTGADTPSVTSPIGAATPASQARQKCLEDLVGELDRNVSQLDFSGGEAVRRTEVLQVNLVVELQGVRHCLIERQRFDLAAGGRRSLQLPLRTKLPTGSCWREGTRHALTALLNIEPAWLDANLRIDEGRYKCSEATRSTCDVFSEYPALKTVGLLHEVTVAMAPLEDVKGLEGLEALGLPAGGDFVTSVAKHDGGERLHVWCWRSSGDQEDQVALALFERYLESRGVDVSQFGKGSQKSLGQLYAEVHTTKESGLVEETDASGAECLIRTLSLMKIKVVLDVYHQQRVLMSSEQYFDDGRHRQVSQLLIHKLRAGEQWGDVLPRAFEERLGVGRELYDACFELVPGSVECEESEEWSRGYPLRTRYTIWKVKMIVAHPGHPGLADLGLPRGNSFISKEGGLGKSQRGRLHVWAWVPMEATGYGNDQEGDNNATGGDAFVGSAVEDICRQLHEAENLVRQTVSHVQSANMGLELPLEQTLTKLKACLTKVVKLDCLEQSADVDVRMLHTTKHLEGAPAAALAAFISTNFTKRLSSVAPPTAPRTMSLDMSAVDFGLSGPAPLVAMPEAIQEMRRNITTFDFSLLGIVLESSDSVFQCYGEIAMGPTCAVLHASMEAVSRFLRHIDSNYYSNPYHNATHAAQVCHAGTWISSTLGLMDRQRSLERAAFVIAALCHDVKHFGRNNAFCVSTSHALAVLYNDSKVLENMHAATCIQALRDEGAGALIANVPEQDRHRLRGMVIELILATDMSEHFQAISKARVRREASDFSLEVEADRRFLAQICLKGGDISHAALGWKSHMQWAERIQREFFDQGDEERRLGVPVSALCDRATVTDLGQSQRGFLDFVCMPLFEELERFMVFQVSAAIDEEDTASEEGDVKALNSRMSAMTSRMSAMSPQKSSAPNALRGSVVLALKENARRWSEDTEAVQQVVVNLKGGS